MQNGTLSSSGIFALQNSTGGVDGVDVVLTGTASLLKSNSGTTALTQADTYTGGTTISGGTLQIGGGGTIGSITGNITNNAALVFNRSDSPTYAGVISGTGTVTQNGPGGTLILTGVNSYTGLTTISIGTIALSGSGSIANSGTVNDFGTFDVSATTSGAFIKSLGGTGAVTLGNRSLGITAAQDIFTGVISGTGSIAITGGTQTFTGANTYTGQTTINSGATLVLSGFGRIPNTSNVTVNGTFDISRSTYQQGAGSTTGAQINALSGSGTVILGNNYLSVSTGAGQIFSGVIQNTGGPSGSGIGIRSGTLTLTGVSPNLSEVGTATGATLALAGAGSIPSAQVDSGGTFDISQTTAGATIAGVNASGTVSLGSKTLTIAATSNGFSGVIQDGGIAGGTGGKIVITGGTQAFGVSGNNTYSGGTTLSGGTLQIFVDSDLGAPNGPLTFSGGTLEIMQTLSTLSSSRAITLNAGGGTVEFYNPITTTIAQGITGTGGLTISGPGILILAGTNTYTGGTTVGAGTLSVTGTVGAVSVASGGTLAGTGKVGATSVASGGILSPGTGGAPGTLTMAGNLTMASGASYLTYFTPTAAGLTAVTGTASVAGTVTVNAASGTYTAGQTYKLITATGGVSGTFASLSTPGLPSYVTGSLSYDANDVILNLNAVSLTPALSASTTTGAGAASSSSSTSPSSGSTGTSSTSSTASASSQATSSGVTANQTSVSNAIYTSVNSGAVPNSGIASLYTLSGASLRSALNQAAGGVTAQTSQAASQSSSPFFALLADRRTADDKEGVALNGVPNGVRPAQAEGDSFNVWGSAFGGHTDISANAATGAPSLTSNAEGLAAGGEVGFDGQFLAGASIGLSHQSFRSSGTGKSNDVLLGLYGRADVLDACYVTAALGYGWHAITTLRSVTVSGTDMLMGKFTGTDFGGRVEAGYRFAVDDELGLTPYAAFAGQNFHTPAYGETAVSGTTNFALAYTANDAPNSHFELGGKLGRGYTLDDGTLSLEGLVAWSHQVQNSSIAQAAFENLPASGFVLLGVKPATNTAVLGIDLQRYESSGLVYGAQVRDQLGVGTSSVMGTLNFAYQW